MGEGQYGKVFLVKHTSTDIYYAMKILNKFQVYNKKQTDVQRRTNAERRILQQNAVEPFLVSLRYAFQTSRYLCMVMKHYEGDSLQIQLQHKMDSMAGQSAFTLPETCFLAAEIVLGIESLHTRSIAHRDLKPDNILMDKDGHVVITDFSFSKEMCDTSRMKTACGTLAYMSPDMFSGEYGKETDLWSFGILIYELIEGIVPFTIEEEEDATIKKITAGHFEFSILDSLDDNDQANNAKDLIKQLLIEPTQRLSITQIKEHPFFEDINWLDILHKQVKPPYIPSSSPIPTFFIGATQNHQFYKLMYTDANIPDQGMYNMDTHFPGFEFNFEFDTPIPDQIN